MPDPNSSCPWEAKDKKRTSPNSIRLRVSAEPGRGLQGSRHVSPQPSVATVGSLIFFEAAVIYFSSSYRLTVLQSHLSSPALSFHTELEPICLGKLFPSLFLLSLSFLHFSFFISLIETESHPSAVGICFELLILLSASQMLGLAGLGCHTWLSVYFSGV